MRASVISAFTKNVPSLSRRSRAVGLAATLLLTGAVQLLPADSAWACGDGSFDSERTAPADPDGRLHPDPSATFRPFSSEPISTDGTWAEYEMSLVNDSTVDYAQAQPRLSLKSGKGSTLRTKDVTVEVMRNGRWQPLPVMVSCGPVLFARTDSLQQPLAHGHSADFRFRVALSATSPQDQTELLLAAQSTARGATTAGGSNIRSVKITHPEPAPAKPAPTKSAPAKPAVAETSTAAKPATTAPATAPKPATTAPAGTPELAQTGADTPNRFLVGSAAACAALGGGVLIAVRRLRRQA